MTNINSKWKSNSNSK